MRSIGSVLATMMMFTDAYGVDAPVKEKFSLPKPTNKAKKNNIVKQKRYTKSKKRRGKQ